MDCVLDCCLYYVSAREAKMRGDGFVCAYGNYRLRRVTSYVTCLSGPKIQVNDRWQNGDLKGQQNSSAMNYESLLAREWHVSISDLAKRGIYFWSKCVLQPDILYYRSGHSTHSPIQLTSSLIELFLGAFCNLGSSVWAREGRDEWVSHDSSPISE